MYSVGRVWDSASKPMYLGGTRVWKWGSRRFQTCFIMGQALWVVTLGFVRALSREVSWFDPWKLCYSGFSESSDLLLALAFDEKLGLTEHITSASQ